MRDAAFDDAAATSTAADVLRAHLRRYTNLHAVKVSGCFQQLCHDIDDDLAALTLFVAGGEGGISSTERAGSEWGCDCCAASTSSILVSEMKGS
jgi:hypothetical protein